ncbi:OmpH family outer membrane protein [Maritimibacter fusiformis]|uniref:OmpH family outer membrane protein n=1 Tax=Maritimibacter fusiformis TaxID=2603819 RepID=A0A5D0RKY3_9RHOB|nr:OmpH family outer membrane protein [Maritimibacter fusiformis]
MGSTLSFLLRLALVLAALATPAQAQQLGEVVSPILTLDREALFSGTLYGKRVNAELEAASNLLAAETRRIEAELEAEERALTEQRATLPAAEFRALADAFDDKVQALREERERTQDAAVRQIEAAQADFFNRIGPILGQLVRERGAVMILDRRAILLTAADVDITRAAIARIDAELGDGDGNLPGDDPAPVPAVPGAPVDTIPAPDAPLDTGTEPDADEGSGTTPGTEVAPDGE